MTLFSIIVPIYNSEKYITQCLNSLVNQTLRDFEILCVDDCSVDDSMKIVENYAKNDNRIKIFYQNENKGVSAARNVALDKACGDYILCVDSDDWIEFNTLEKLYNAFEKSGATSVWFDGFKYYQNTSSIDKNPINNRKNEYIELLPEVLPTFSDMCGMKAYTRNSIQNIGLHWPENIKMDEDGEFYFKYYSFYTQVYAISDCLYYWRKHDSSASNLYSQGVAGIKDTYNVIENLIEYYKQYGIYEKYKITLLKLIENRISFCKSVNYSKENKKVTLDFLNRINFLEEFKQNSENPLVSIVVPFCNAELYIEQCLKSITSQTYKNIEIICVDDCSDDASGEIVEKLAMEDCRIKVFKHKVNKGPGGARNTGTKNANGVYLLFVDADDWITKDCVSTVVEKMVNTDYNSIWFKADFWNEKLKKVEKIKFYENFIDMPEQELMLDGNNITSFITAPWNKIYRTSYLKQPYFCWKENIIYEDDEFYWRMFTKFSRVYVLDKYLYYYRQHPASIIHKESQGIAKAKDAFFVVEEIFKNLKDNGLYEKYELAFTRYAFNVLNMFDFSIGNTNELKQAKLKLLNKLVNYPTIK